MDLTDKVVVVTGGSAGLGEQVCYEAAKRGAIVVTCARRINLIGQVRERCSELSGKDAYAFQLDIADPDSVEAVIEKIAAEVGDVDVLVNNAGFGLFDNFVDFDLDVAKNMFEVNVLGIMYFTQKIAISMVNNKSGHIFNVASMAAGFSNALRLELRPANVYVTTINPGPIATEFFDKADPSGSYLENLGGIVLDPHKLAKTIVNKMGKPTREINRPFIMEGASIFYGLFPHIGDFLAGGLFNRK